MSAPPPGEGDAGAPRRVLSISYYYPPSGQPGALRSVKFAKYLPRGGWEAVVVTPAAFFSTNMGWRGDDADAAIRVVATRDPLGIQRASAGMQRALAGSGGARARGPVRRALVGLAQSLVVPDRAAPWYPFAVRAADEVVRAGGVRAVWSTSLPITSHLVAMRVARRHRLPWIADFRDPWTSSLHYHAGAVRRRVDRALERTILQRADRVVVVSEAIREQFAEAHPESRGKVVVIRNGFDPDDFTEAAGAPPADRFVLTYAGLFYGHSRDPGPLLHALAELRRSGELDAEGFRFRIVGPPDPVVAARAAEAGVADLLEPLGPMPYHETLRQLQASSATLVICHSEPEARGEMPTKFFDSLGVGRPVALLAPPDFELARLARERGLAQVAHPRDRAEIAALLRRLLRGEAAPPPPDAARAFTREAGALLLAEHLDALCAAPRP